MGCPVTVACGSPPDGSVGTPYTHTFPTTGGPNLYFSIISGALPPGLTLDPATGVVSGTPTTAGPYSFTVKVIDAQIMATGDDGSFSDSKIVITSDDGSTWTRQTTAITDSGWSVIYSPELGLWVNGTDFAGTTDQIQTSPDGVSGNWTAVSTPANNKWIKKLASGAGTTVVALYGTSSPLTLMTTTDGSTWTNGTLPSGTQILGDADVAYSPDLGMFVVAQVTNGGNTGVLQSTDGGATWSFVAAASPDILPVRSLTWGNGIFVGVGGPVGSGEHLMVSADGSNWTIYTTVDGTNISWAAVHFANGRFVAVSDDTSTSAGNQAAYSDDGITWTVVSTPTTTKRWQCVSYGFGIWLAGAINSANTQPLMKSTDNGVTWALVSALGFNFGFIAGIAFGPIDNCSDTAACSITIGGTTMGNVWGGGSAQGAGNHW